jgi:hypothetical protein
VEKAILHRIDVYRLSPPVKDQVLPFIENDLDQISPRSFFFDKIHIEPVRLAPGTDRPLPETLELVSEQRGDLGELFELPDREKALDELFDL